MKTYLIGPFRTLVGCTVSLLLCIAALSLPTAAQPPAQGIFVPELAAFDTLMQDFMSANGITAGQLAITRHGSVVFDRAYGWQDEQKSKPLPVGALMRIASLSKPFTAAAVQKLLVKGSIALNSRIFSFADGDGGLLRLEPIFEDRTKRKVDPRLKDITVEHCLFHRGGWDREVPGIPDWTRQERKIAKVITGKFAPPPSRVDTIRYIMGLPLQFTPGSRYAYSNIGYLALGLVIEKFGSDYLTFLHDNVTQDAGIKNDDVKLAMSLQSDADPREPNYISAGLKPSVFDPAAKAKKVPEAYGGFNMEARTSQGRILTNARSIVLLLEYLGKGIWSPYRWEFTHMGELPGTDSLARARGDRISYVVIFNKKGLGGSYAGKIRKEIDALIDVSEKITAWPKQ
jgi:CubicO group peptidase (beta-lactamase class C family)